VIHAADGAGFYADVFRDAGHVVPEFGLIFDELFALFGAEDDVNVVAGECLGHGGCRPFRARTLTHPYPGLTAWASPMSRLRRWGVGALTSGIHTSRGVWSACENYFNEKRNLRCVLLVPVGFHIHQVKLGAVCGFLEPHYALAALGAYSQIDLIVVDVHVSLVFRRVFLIARKLVLLCRDDVHVG